MHKHTSLAQTKKFAAYPCVLTQPISLRPSGIHTGIENKQGNDWLPGEPGH